MAKPSAQPKERRQTLRQDLLWHLRQCPHTALELSRLVGIREKEIANHLEHLAKSLRHSKQKLRIQPAQCLSCDFVFKERTRFTKPSACPRCRRQTIEPPVFHIQA